MSSNSSPPHLFWKPCFVMVNRVFMIHFLLGMWTQFFHMGIRMYWTKQTFSRFVKMTQQKFLRSSSRGDCAQYLIEYIYNLSFWQIFWFTETGQDAPFLIMIKHWIGIIYWYHHNYDILISAKFLKSVSVLNIWI